MTLTKSSYLPLQNLHPYHQHRCYHPKVEFASSISGSSETSRRLHHGASASNAMEVFMLAVEDALNSCDIDSPGARTAPPQHPSLNAIRQSREAYQAVWKEYYQLRHTPLPRDIQQQLRQPTFNNWPYSDAQLLRFIRFFFTGDDGLTPYPSQDGAAEAMLMSFMDDRLCLAKRCEIPEEILDVWLCAVYAKYNRMYASICSADLASLFCHLDLFTLLFAAVCHDLDHPGLTNVYQNNAQSRLSILYNTLSPLENHHCAVAFELVRTPATNIFINFTSKEFEIVRQNTVRCILGTDISKHTDILEAFTAKMVEHSIEGAALAIRGGLSTSNESTPADSVLNGSAPTISQLSAIFEEDDESHALTMVVLLKMCDISTEIRPDAVARPWLKGLISELSSQRDLERRTNLPLSPLMDESNLVQCQINFLSFAMLPLAKALISIIPALEASRFHPISRLNSSFNTCFLKPTQEHLAHYRQIAAEQAAAQQSQQFASSPSETVVGQDESTGEENNSKWTSNSSEIPDQLKNSVLEGEEFNGFTPTTDPLSIPYFEDQEQREQNNPSSASPQLCISSSNPDREPPGHAFHHSHPHMYSSCGLAVCDGARNAGGNKRTSIVSSAGLIAAELTPPHRPLRRSLGELPWSAHALLLTHLEDTTPHPQPPPPPPQANRSVVSATTAPTQPPKMSGCGGSSNEPKASSS
ncbi:hypothetical protein ACTXT7_006784 [Hymenolepis weldensis]